MYRATAGPGVRTHRGEHLIPEEEVQERAKAEKEDRLARFTQGAEAFDPQGSRTMGPWVDLENPGYEEAPEPVSGGQLHTDLDDAFDALREAFYGANTRNYE